MEKITFRGRTYRRPTRVTKRRVWRTPKREQRRNVEIRYSRIQSPGLTHLSERWDNGEGISYATWFIHWGADRVTRALGGSDCEGRLHQIDEFRVEKDGSWTLIDGGQYDQFAQAAGY